MNVVITGVTSGIGLELCKEYIKRGYRVIGVARRKEVLEGLKKEYRDDFDYVCGDLSKVEELEDLCERIDSHGIVDILVNNAGMGVYGELEDIEINDEKKMLYVNVVALTYLTRRYLKIMNERNGGGIINVASTAGFQWGGPLMASYYGSKAYVVALDEGIRGELEEKRSGIRLVTLCPGPTSSEFVGMKGKKEWYLTTPREVAVAGINGFEKGSEIVIPGLVNKVLYFINRLIPRKLQRKLIYKIQLKKSSN